MNCIKCNVSMFDKPLSRTKPTGQPDAGWMCQDCMQKREPDLYNSLKSDGDLKITNAIFDAINPPVEDFQRCPKCGAKEISANTPRTVYACGSSDYDQRLNTFTQSFNCQDNQKKAMTAEEYIISKLSSLIPEYKTQRGIEQLAINLIITSATEYASQQREAGIREGFEAARATFIPTLMIKSKMQYPTVDDYLSTKS